MRILELTVSKCLKRNIAQYESAEVFAAAKAELESTDQAEVAKAYAGLQAYVEAAIRAADPKRPESDAQWSERVKRERGGGAETAASKGTKPVPVPPAPAPTKADTLNPPSGTGGAARVGTTGASPAPPLPVPQCAKCGATVTPAVASYSQKHFGRNLCMEDQRQETPLGAGKGRA